MTTTPDPNATPTAPAAITYPPIEKLSLAARRALLRKLDERLTRLRVLVDALQAQLPSREQYRGP